MGHIEKEDETFFIVAIQTVLYKHKDLLRIDPDDIGIDFFQFMAADILNQVTYYKKAIQEVTKKADSKF